MSRSIEKRPNLVYVFADQLRYQSCGYAEDTRAHGHLILTGLLQRVWISATLSLVVRCVRRIVPHSSPANTPVALAW